jgi:Protein of unknown function (DUF3634)
MSKFIIKLKLIFLRITERPTIIITVYHGQPNKVLGNVKNSFLVDCKEICKRNNIHFGIIYVTKGNFGGSILKSSSEIPAEALQQLRNTWGFNF